MRWLFLLFTTLLFSSQIDWHENLSEAITIAKRDNKAIFLFLMKEGSKLQIFDKENFHLIHPYFVFVKIDPSEIQDKYRIDPSSFVLLLDKENNLICNLNLSFEEQYPKRVKDLLQEYYSFQKLDLTKLSLKELKGVYRKAQAFSEDIRSKIVEVALKQQEDTYFLLEQYNLLLKKNLQEAKDLKKKLIASDPHNLKGTIYKIAIIQFEHRSSNCMDPFEVIKPIVKYINKFGKMDRDNIWHLEMLISHFFSNKKMYKEALIHARASYKVAPIFKKQQLVQNILDLKKKISNPN